MEASKFQEKLNELDSTPSPVLFTQALLIQIQESLCNFPGYDDVDRFSEFIPNESTKTFHFCRYNRKNFKSASFLHLTDGMAVLWNTRNSLEDRSHRLNVPRQGNEFSYHREAYNVDIQAIGSKVLNLSGVEQIAQALPTIANDLVKIVGVATLFNEIDWAGSSEKFGRFVSC